MSRFHTFQSRIFLEFYGGTKMDFSKGLNRRLMLRYRATAIEFLTKVHFSLYFALSFYMS